MKHPGPWTVAEHYLWDANDEIVCSLPDDPEARAILTHAAEMWEVLKSVGDVDRITPHGVLYVFVDKINAEIAAAKGDGT